VALLVGATRRVARFLVYLRTSRRLVPTGCILALPPSFCRARCPVSYRGIAPFGRQSSAAARYLNDRHRALVSTIHSPGVAVAVSRCAHSRVAPKKVLAQSGVNQINVRSWSTRCVRQPHGEGLGDMREFSSARNRNTVAHVRRSTAHPLPQQSLIFPPVIGISTPQHQSGERP
jgi:hypothetical protein